MAQFDKHRVGVVHRHDPAAHHRSAEAVLLAAVFPDRRHLLQVGQDIFHHPRPDVVADPAGRDIDHPDRRLDEVQLRQYAKFVGEHRAADDRVEKRGMGRVHRVFQDLQPVARIEIFLARDHAIARADEAVEHRERRLLVGRAQIGKDDAVRLTGRIGAVKQPVLQRAVGWLARRFQDRAVAIEQPAVVAAADALVADQAEFERGAAVRAMQL